MIQFKKYLFLFVLMTIGILASIAGFLQFVQLEETEAQNEFVLAASERMIAIERQIQSSLDSVFSIKSFY